MAVSMNLGVLALKGVCSKYCWYSAGQELVFLRTGRQFLKVGVLSVGVLAIRAPLLGYMKGSDFGKLQHVWSLLRSRCFVVASCSY